MVDSRKWTTIQLKIKINIYYLSIIVCEADLYTLMLLVSQLVSTQVLKLTN